MTLQHDIAHNLATVRQTFADASYFVGLISVSAASNPESRRATALAAADFQRLLAADLRVLLSQVRRWRLETLAWAGDDGLRIIEAEAAWVDDDEDDATWDPAK